MQDGNADKEEYVESDDNSMIVTFQFNLLHNSSRKVIEDGRYTDTNILIDTGSTCSVFNSNKMLLNIRASD